MTDIYVVTPFDIFTKKELFRRREQLAKEGRKVMAIVFNCRSLQDFEIKYFGEQLCFDKATLNHWNNKIAIEQ